MVDQTQRSVNTGGDESVKSESFFDNVLIVARSRWRHDEARGMDDGECTSI